MSFDYCVWNCAGFIITLSDMIRFDFNSSESISWIKRVCEIRHTPVAIGEDILFAFDNLDLKDCAPEHVATLACLIEHFSSLRHRVLIDKSPVGLFLWEKCRLRQYWGGRQNYSESPDETILNLWRINVNEKDLHGTSVTAYLKNKYFKHKDLSAVANSLTEAYYNVFDHADAQGNAFSMLMYNQETEVLRVAVCDFGKGIARTVKDFLKVDIRDSEAIGRAIQTDFSIKSKEYNAGLGLKNICDCCTERDSLHIVGNSGAVCIENGCSRYTDLGFSFGGTLIFYSISLSHFEDEEIINDFNL